MERFQWYFVRVQINLFAWIAAYVLMLFPDSIESALNHYITYWNRVKAIIFMAEANDWLVFLCNQDDNDAMEGIRKHLIPGWIAPQLPGIKYYRADFSQ